MNRNDLPEPNATCEICGHKYRICQKCAQMRLRGIEAWRQHCDSYECATVYYLLQKDKNEISKEEFEYVMNTELPEDRQFTKEVQLKLDSIEHYINETEKENNEENNY